MASTYPSIHVKTLKITVGCPLCTYPSIHVETLKITVGCLTSAYPSIRNKNLHTCWTPWSTHETRELWARPPVLSPVPSQAIHSRACLNLHHSDILRALRRNHLVSTFFEAFAKKQNRNLLVTVWEPGQDIQNKDNGHVRQQRARRDMMQWHFSWSMASPGRHQAQSDAVLQVGHRACGRRRHVNHLRLRRCVWHGRVVIVV